MAIQTRVSRSAHPLRLIAIAAFALAVVLTGWRAVSVFSPKAAPASASLQERSLVSLLEPVTGAGQVRLSVNRHSDGSKAYLVLVDGPVPDAGATSTHAPLISDLLTSAAGYNAASDSLTIRQFPFARNLAAGIAPSDIAELSLLLALVALSAGLAFAPYSTSEPAVDLRTPLQAANEIEARQAMYPPPAFDVSIDDATDLATRDAAATASVIRRWMAANDRDS